eukprot:2133857-Rhodomonas_salina.3
MDSGLWELSLCVQPQQAGDRFARAPVAKKAKNPHFKEAPPLQRSSHRLVTVGVACQCSHGLRKFHDEFVLTEPTLQYFGRPII